MRFTSYIPALDVLTTQLDSLSKPSRPHKIKNIFFATLSLSNGWAFRFILRQAQDSAAGYSLQSFYRAAQHSKKDFRCYP